MPVILDAGSDSIRTWLDPARNKWSKELQSILKPYEGELDCYPVSKEVGKVGNNSPGFIIPVDSKENKSNIANFFANATKKEPASPDSKPVAHGRPAKDSEWREEKTPKSGSAVKREHSLESTGDADESKKPMVKPESTNSTPQKKKLRSATHNSPMKKPSGTKTATGAQPITNFFKK